MLGAMFTPREHAQVSHQHKTIGPRSGVCLSQRLTIVPCFTLTVDSS
jgi:hypothetical protein